jgi:hypothetical protein
MMHIPSNKCEQNVHLPWMRHILSAEAFTRYIGMLKHFSSYLLSIKPQKYLIVLFFLVCTDFIKRTVTKYSTLYLVPCFLFKYNSGLKFEGENCRHTHTNTRPRKLMFVAQ